MAPFLGETMRPAQRLTAALACLLLVACGSSSTTGPNNANRGPAPDISSVTPSQSPLDGGGYLIVRGLGFKAGATVAVGGAPGKNVVVVDRETLTFQAPSGRPGAADLVVQNTDGGQTKFAGGVTYAAPTAPAPTLTHLTPNSGPSGGGTYARLDGTNFTSGAVLIVAGAPAGLVQVVSPTLVTAQLPGHSGSGTGDVIVTSADGQSAVLFGGFAYSDSLTAKAPRVTAVAPTEGPLTGGNAVVISVDNVVANGLLFIGGVPTVFEPAAGGLSVIMPAGLRHGLVDVAFTNADGQSDLLHGAYNYFEAHLVVPPSLARVTPGRAPTAGGGRVIVEGDGFLAGAQVLFGKTLATGVVVASSHLLTCLVPPGAAGPADVTVQNLDGGIVHFRGGFLYADSGLPAPTVVKTSPNTGPASGGTVAEIDGTRFVDGAVVMINGYPAGKAFWNNDGVLTARFAANNAGTADVTVTNPDGQSGTLVGGFVIAASVTAAAPRVNAVTPGGGPLEGGLPVFITGDGFSPAPLVFIGGRKAAATSQGAAALVATLPASLADGNADIAVTNPDGQSDVLPAGFNYYVSAPVIGAVSPSCGPATGGTTVVISGRSLRVGVSASVGGQPLSGLVRSDSATLTGTTAAHAPGQADLSVVNPDGQSDLLSSSFFFTDSTHPCQSTVTTSLALQRVVPGNGPSSGGSVITLVGAGFVPGATVQFGGTAANNVRLLGSGALTCTLPVGTVGPTDVTITLPDGRQSRLAAAFEYFNPASNAPPPTLSSVAPNAGPNTGGTTVELTGSNFAASVRVFFGATEAALPTVVDSTRAVAVTPLSLAGPTDVTLINPDGKSATLSLGFAYYPSGAAGAPPSAQFATPRTGSTLAPTAVVVTGTGFQAGALVFFGGVPATGISLQSNGSLALTVAPQSSSTVDITVTNPDGQSTTLSQGFTFSPPTPHLLAVSPGFAPLRGGTSVVVTGSGFLPTDTIQFDTSNAGVKVLDDTALFAVVPQHAGGLVNVSLLRGGVTQDTLVGVFEYRANYEPGPPPSITSLQPPTGPTSGGTVLWLTGANIVSGAQVFFGGNAAIKVLLADSGHAVVTAPPGIAGNADVTIINPDGQSTALLRGFAYVSDALLQGFAPRLTSATPSQGPESSPTVDILTGRNFVQGELVIVGAALGSGVKLLSPSILSTTFPPQPAGQVDLSVTNPDGRSSTVTNGFTYLPRPGISDQQGVIPGTGPTAGGTHVTVAGSGFLPGATLTFARTPATSVQVQSGNVLTAVTPAGLAGPVDVQLINPDGQTALAPGAFLFVPPPAGQLMQPAQGPTAGGTIAVVTGTGFSSGSQVFFGTSQAIAVLYGSPTTLIVTTPAGTGSVDVSVKNADNQSSTLPAKFVYNPPPYLPPPTLTGTPILPVRGLDTGGTYATLSGSSFQPGALAIVGEEPLTHIILVDPPPQGSGTTLTGITGPGNLGAAMVAVTNPDGQSVMVANAFTYTDHTVAGAPPILSTLVPSSAPAPGGTSVVFNGSGFATGALVYLGGRPALLQGSPSPTLLNVRSPAAPAGVGDAVVTNPDGQSFTLTSAFTFLVPPPFFASSNPITPAAGPTAGGNAVKISGSYFLPPVSVYFGNSQVQSITHQDPNELDVVAPAGLAGPTAVRIVNSDGQPNTLPGGYTYRAPPVLTSVSPTSGPPAGNISVHLTGNFFMVDSSNLSAVLFGQAPVTAITTSTSTDLVVSIPGSGLAGSLTVAITITNKDGQSVSVPGAFVYLPPAQPPILNGVTPNSSALAGNLVITVLGAHFQYGARVFFGDYNGQTDGGAAPPECTSAVVQSDGALTCVAPAAQAAGVVDITVINPDGKQAVLPQSFTYVAGPPPAQLALLNIAPGSGDVLGGTSVIISGQGFLQGATANLVNPANTTQQLPLTNQNIVGPTAITAKTPAQPITGTNPTNWDVWVKNPGSPAAILHNAWSYGTGKRHFIPQGLRMPLESNSRKYNRGGNINVPNAGFASGRATVGWQGVIGDFSQANGATRDAIMFGYSGRNPRLLQGSPDPLNTNAVVFRDTTSVNLLNADGTPMRDQCCGSTNSPSNRDYSAFEPRVFTVPQISTWQNVSFWNDAQYVGFSILWNSNGVLQATEYGPGPGNQLMTDYVGGGTDTAGKLVDFNLDGYADFAFAGDSGNWLMLSCGTGLASPYCAGPNLPTLSQAVTPGSATASISGQWQALSTTLIPNVTKLVIDDGAAQEVVTVTAVAANNTTMTATYQFAHPAGTVWAPFTDTTSPTAITTPGVDQVITLASMSGIGTWYYQVLTLDAGTANEERLSINAPASLSPNYTTKTINLHPLKKHAAGMTVTTRSPYNFAMSTSRFPNNFGQAYTMIAGDIDGNGATDLVTGHTPTAGSIHVWLNNAIAKRAANASGDSYNFSFVESTTATFQGAPPTGSVHALAYFASNPSNSPLQDLLVGFDSPDANPHAGQQELLFINTGGGIYKRETAIAKPAGCTQGTRIPSGDLDAILRYEVVDIDGRNGPDIIGWVDQTNAPNTTQRPLRLWLNDGNGCYFGQSTNYQASGGQVDTLLPTSLISDYRYALGDFNRDGLPDMIMAVNSFQSREYVNEGGFFADKTVSNLPNSQPGAANSVAWWRYTLGAVLVDVNADGFPDLISSQINYINNDCCNPAHVTNPDGNVRIFLNDHKGNFPVDYTMMNLPTHQNGNQAVSDLPIATFSIDAGKVGAVNGNIVFPGPDLLIGNLARYSAGNIPYPPTSLWYNTQGSIRLLLNTPDANGLPTGQYIDGTYPRLPPNQTFAYASTVKMVDLDNDGNNDIIIGYGDRQAISIWKNTGNGFFQDVTSTAVAPYSASGNQGGDYVYCGNAYEGVRALTVGNFDQDNLDRQDILLSGECGLRMLINHSDTVAHTILMVDETVAANYNGNVAPRLPGAPTADSVVVGDFDCNGTPDLYVIDASGGEHVLLNEACTTPDTCGHFTPHPDYLLPASVGSQCIGSDCYGNAKAIGIKYDSQNVDVLISRYSNDDTLRPYRLLKNLCGGGNGQPGFQELSLASWLPFPTSNDKTSAVLSGDIFGRHDGNPDLIFFNEYGPRIYQNSP